MVKIAIVGDSMIDEYVHGTLLPSQDGCPKFVEDSIVRIPGGAANAARALEHSGAEVFFIGPAPDNRPLAVWRGVNTDLAFFQPTQHFPIKTRFLDQTGKIAFRRDREMVAYGQPQAEMNEWRDLAIKAVKNMSFDAVYVADYAKGFVDETMIRQMITVCERARPIVVDPKRDPACCRRAVIKCNEEYWKTWFQSGQHPCGKGGLVVTRGHKAPYFFTEGWTLGFADGAPVQCVNHVGAGDCFGSWLALNLGRGMSLKRAAQFAHAAGQVYVQYPHNRPPWPHEIAKQLDPVRGKILGIETPSVTVPGRVVFTNGVFRLPHAGHAWLLDWARKQGDVLVVGVNDDASAARLRPGEFVMPLAERTAMLASMQAVDWIIPFTEDEPCEAIKLLKPSVLVKGHEYEGQMVPGQDLVETVLFAPPSPYPAHAADLVAMVRG